MVRNTIKQPFTIILCGLSGSGKSTLGKGVYDFLIKKNIGTELMDADVYRKILSPNEPFDEPTRDLFRKKLFFIAKLLNRNNICAVIPMICSNSKIRNFARNEIKNLYEIYLKTSLDECIRRNTKGHYTKVNGKFKKNLIGIDIPFIEPIRNNLTVDCEKNDKNKSLEIILESLVKDIDIINEAVNYD